MNIKRLKKIKKKLNQIEEMLEWNVAIEFVFKVVIILLLIVIIFKN